MAGLRSRSANFCLLPVEWAAGGQSVLGLRFVLCHKVGALGEKVAQKAALRQSKTATGTGDTMTELGQFGVTRRGILGVFAATVAVAAPTYSKAFGLLTGSGDIRRIRMYSGRTGESIDTIYWIEGEYIREAMKEINYFMRDWRSGDTIKIDARTIDIMAASHRLMDVSEPYMLLSGYRCPATNAMLRSKSSGVARNSLHLKGQAADLRL